MAFGKLSTSRVQKSTKTLEHGGSRGGSHVTCFFRGGSDPVEGPKFESFFSVIFVTGEAEVIFWRNTNNEELAFLPPWKGESRIQGWSPKKPAPPSVQSSWVLPMKRWKEAKNTKESQEGKTNTHPTYFFLRRFFFWNSHPRTFRGGEDNSWKRSNSQLATPPSSPEVWPCPSFDQTASSSVLHLIQLLTVIMKQWRWWTRSCLMSIWVIWMLSRFWFLRGPFAAWSCCSISSWLVPCKSATAHRFSDLNHAETETHWNAWIISFYTSNPRNYCFLPTKNYFTSSDPHHDMLGGGCQVRVVK